MKKHKYSDYENYILTADKCGLRLGYESFLDFKVIVSFIKEIASKTGDTFLHNGTIYNKKITSEAAKRFLDNLNYGSQGYYNGGATGPMPVGGSQNFNLNMNFDVASGQTESQQGQGQSNGQKGQDQNINQFAQNIRKLVQEEIQKEQRAGGLLRGTRR